MLINQHTENDQVIWLVKDYREKDDRRASRSLLHSKILNHIVRYHVDRALHPTR